MKLKHAILLNTPMGQQVLTPHTLDDSQLDAALANIKAQLQVQGIDPRQLAILTDIEFEEGEYEITEVKDGDNQKRKDTETNKEV